MSDPIHTSLAHRYPGKWDHHYVAAKLRTDPLYPAVLSELKNSTHPLLDLGCGLGLLALFLRAHGHQNPILGLDYDPRKIQTALHVSQTETHLHFQHHDARQGLPPHTGDVTILDILQFFTPAQQEKLLLEAAARTAPGAKLIIRSGLRDPSLRFKITVAGDLLAKCTLWMKAAPTHYPTAEDFTRLLTPFGTVKISPLWGKTPFNNHLITLTKPNPPTPT